MFNVDTDSVEMLDAHQADDIVVHSKSISVSTVGTLLAGIWIT